MRPLLRLATGLAAALVAVLLTCPAARSDGDPASDVLLGQNVFYPYAPPVSSRLQASLNAETAAAAQAHFPVKVALIGGPADLGVIPELFGKPQAYADFLGQELRLVLGPHTLLLVVMPDGFGMQGLRTVARAVAGTLPRPTGTQTNGLARAAIVAVRRLAAVAGHPLGRIQTAAGAGSGGGASPLTLVGVSLASVAIAAGILLARRRLSVSR